MFSIEYHSLQKAEYIPFENPSRYTNTKRSVNLESKLWCLQFSQKIDQKIRGIIVLLGQFFRFFVRFLGELRITILSNQIALTKKNPEKQTK